MSTNFTEHSKAPQTACAQQITQARFKAAHPFPGVRIAIFLEPTGQAAVFTCMKTLPFSSQSLLPTGRLLAPWQCWCYTGLTAILAAFLYFGGNALQYGATPRVLLPDGVSAYESGRRKSGLLKISVAAISGDWQSKKTEQYAWFVAGQITPLSRESLREIVWEYAKSAVPSLHMYGREGTTTLSENAVWLYIDARCPAQRYAELFEVLRECGIWKLVIAVRSGYDDLE